MQIQIIEDPNIERTEIRVICKKKTPELYDAVSEFGVLADTFVGRRDGEIHFVSLPDILYFETVDDSIFFYTHDQIYQTGLRLYKIEEMLAKTSFQRISKSVIVNLHKVRMIQRAQYGKLIAVLYSGEKLVVSRHYVREIRNKLRCENV